ncbi:hypothetical protein BDD12DRAFT_439583 [Trichophaea hybrida]|nr:hypothetical protein BDD12DRAFT_439583 [Trichophaea hybrida]
MYNAAKGVANVTGKAIRFGYRGANAVRGTVTRVGGAVRSIFPRRYDPMRGRKPKTPVKKTPKDSMLDLPPHMVGATPNVVRQARGERLRGQPGEHTPTTEEAREWDLFHATPLPKKPRPAPETPLPNTGPGTPWKTPKFEFNTPQRKMKIGKTREFAMNVHKGEFKDWLRLLKKHGVGTTALRRELNENLAFPTDLVLLLHNQKVKGQSRGFDSLVKCFSHEGFTTHYKILVPILKNPAPLKFRHGEVEGIDINAVHQQSDGCCRFCRGFSWAGQVETREINKGEDVPCQSLHRSVVLYTAEEKAEFAHNKYDMLFRRWCRESRYDWIFEPPKTSDWEIPKDDPRLRHISMVKQQNKATYGAPKMYDGDLVAGYNQRRADLTKQDIAAKILIDAVRKENPVLAATYEKMDLERKRRQVKIDWLCVKQVKVVLKVPIPKRKASEVDSNDHKLSKDDSSRHPSHDPTPEKPAKRVKFASQPAGPTINGQKTPAKGILKTTNGSLNKNKTQQSWKKSTFKKARIASSTGTADGTSHGLSLLSDAHQFEAKAGVAPIFQFNAPLTHRSSSQSQLLPLTHKPSSMLDEKSSFLAPAHTQQTNPQINFAAVPALSYQVPRPQSNQVFFFGASSKSAAYDGHLPPAFDPAVIRQQYNIGITNASDFWDDPKPFGWNPDPNLTKEENDAERFNYNIQKFTEQQQREKELRAMEIAEENARKQPAVLSQGPPQMAKV